MRIARNALIAAAALAAVAMIGQPSIAAPRTGQRLAPAEKRGLQFAKRHCAACHAVVAGRTSPNPAAPPFQDIANRPVYAAPTLREFLRDSHNFPAEMNFKLEDAQIDDLSEYLVRLERPN